MTMIVAPAWYLPVATMARLTDEEARLLAGTRAIETCSWSSVSTETGWT